MKLLFIAPNYSYPAVKGYQLMLIHHIEQLAPNNSIDLIFFGKNSNPLEDPILSLCKKVNIIKLPKWKIALNLISGFFTKIPFQVCLYQSKEMSLLIENTLKRNYYDGVVFYLSRMAQFLPGNYQGTSILNMIDPLALNYSRSLFWRPWYWKFLLNIEIARLVAYEKSFVSRFDCVTLISEMDISDYRKFFNDVNFQQLPYGVNLDYFSRSDEVPRTPGMIVIIGNMGYAPNVDAVKYFCSEIFPLILASRPDAHIWIVGARPSSSIKKLSKQKNITVTGYVTDIRKFLNCAMVSVCPVRLNVGTQTKVLEALAMKVPVVTTTAGNLGVGGVSGHDLIVADSPEDMAKNVISLLREDKWTFFSNQGRIFVSDHFGWDKSGKKLLSIIKKLAKVKD
jgi:glycosyltransferase involved in cell wall biosynthesis